MVKTGTLHKVGQLAVVLMLGMGAAATAQAQSAMEELAKDQNREWNRLFNSEQAGQLADLYAEDALVSPANGNVIKGREAIRKLFDSYFENGFDQHRLSVIKADGGENWFYEVAEWGVTGAPQNAVIPYYEGIVTLVFKKNDDGEWRIHSHTWNQEPANGS